MPLHGPLRIIPMPLTGRIRKEKAHLLNQQVRLFVTL
jgi:hypothetical protein